MATPKWMEIVNKRKAKNDAQEVKTFKLPDGKTTLRILPNPNNPESPFFADFGEHWIKHPTEKNAQGKPKIVGVPVCMAKAFEQVCPYCDALAEAKRHIEDNRHDYSDEEVEIIEGAESRHRVLVNAAVRVGGGYEVKLVELASTAFNSLIEIITEYGEEVVRDAGGLDVVFTRSGTGINTKYTVMPARKPGEDIDAEWKTKAIDLEQYVNSRLLDPARAAGSIAAIGETANLSLSAPALTATPTPAIATTPASAKYGTDTVEDDDGLEDELDDIPFTSEESAPAVVNSTPVSEQNDADADDLLSQLDDLDNL